jgi:hypothetical protein
MSEKPTKLGWRIFWGIFATGLVGAILVTAAPGLGLPVIAGISVGSGIAVAILGPILLEVFALL